MAGLTRIGITHDADNCDPNLLVVVPSLLSGREHEREGARAARVFHQPEQRVRLAPGNIQRAEWRARRVESVFTSKQFPLSSNPAAGYLR